MKKSPSLESSLMNRRVELSSVLGGVRSQLVDLGNNPPGTPPPGGN